MPRENLDERLSRISTQWTLFFQAHGGPTEVVTGAQRQLLLRYSGAVYRYLLGAVRDADSAEELAQEFALRFLRGDFHRAHPQRGQFRDYLKTALIHLVTDYHRAQHAWPKQAPSDAPEPVAPPQSTDSGPDFVASWRDELLEQTWKALAEFNPDYEQALRCRVENPELSSAEMAHQIEARLGKPVNATWVRKAVQRAHEKFSDLMLDEVAHSLEEPSPEVLAEELQALDLLKYCRSALERRRGKEQRGGG